MTDIPRRPLSWAELHAMHMEDPTFSQRTRDLCPFDWATLPIHDLGTRFCGANLTSAVMRQCPSALQLQCGRQAFWEEFRQRDINAHRLMGGIRHPFERVRSTLEKLVHHWPHFKGRVAVLPPITLYSGRLDMQFRGEPVEADVVALPPIECVGLLRSGPLSDDDHASQLALLWYQSDFGLDPDVLSLIRKLSWERHAIGMQY